MVLFFRKLKRLCRQLFIHSCILRDKEEHSFEFGKMESSRLRKARPISLPSTDSCFHASLEGEFCTLLSDPFPSLQGSTSEFHPRHKGKREEILQNFLVEHLVERRASQVAQW